MVLPASSPVVETSKPAGGPATAVPAVVLSDSAEAMVAASWSTWVCACTRVWSRSLRSAAIWPEFRRLLDTTSSETPFESLMLSCPTPLLVGLLLYCDVASSVPGEEKVNCELRRSEERRVGKEC